MFLGQTVGRGWDPCPLLGSRQARGQGSMAVPAQDGLAERPPTVHPEAGRPRAGGRAPGALCKPVGFRPGRIWGFFSHSFHFLAFGTAPWALGALPLPCPAPAGPSGEAGLGCGALGVWRARSRSGWGLFTEVSDSGWWYQGGVRGPGRAPDPAAPPGLGDLGSHVRGGVGGLALPGGLRVGAQGLGANVCPVLPPASASDVALGLEPRAQRPWGRPPKPPDLAESVRTPDNSSGPARGRPLLCLRQRGPGCGVRVRPVAPLHSRVVPSPEARP